MQLSENLLRLRKQQGWSQEHLAQELQVSRQAVSKWETGQSTPETETLIVISDLYGISLDQLVRGDRDRPVFTDAEAKGRFRYQYEYKSKRTLLGLPLLHVCFGKKGKHAKGILAIGDFPVGIVAVGLLARGILSIGALSLGLMSFGGVSIGLLSALGGLAVGIFALGGLSLGIFACGGLAIGMFATGGLAIASCIAIGDFAVGHLAFGISNAVGDTVVTLASHDGVQTALSKQEIQQTIMAVYPRLWEWVVRLLTCYFV